LIMFVRQHSSVCRSVDRRMRRSERADGARGRGDDGGRDSGAPPVDPALRRGAPAISQLWGIPAAAVASGRHGGGEWRHGRACPGGAHGQRAGHGQVPAGGRVLH